MHRVTRPANPRGDVAPTIERTYELSDADRAAVILSDEDVESRIAKTSISAYMQLRAV